ncbi:MAG: IPT/TIG domain-containing protein [Acidobacteria bacterium]|nr:IPT/TIG domain-containing protein [Acidobacteriota bacterium]
MKQWVRVSLSIAAGLGIAALGAIANSSGAVEGHSGAPGETNCTECHIGTANSGPGKVTVELVNASSYTPGQTYRVRITIDDSAATRRGFQLSVRPDSNPRISAGKLATVNANAQILPGGTQEWATHTLAGQRTASANPGIFELDWTAPAADAGPITFFAAGNAANGNGNESGDRIYTTTLKVAPATTTAGPSASFAAAGVTDAWNGRQGIAPGMLVSISGTELASAPASWSPTTLRALDTTVGGVKVKVNTTDAAVVSVSADRILFIAPADAPEGDVNIIVERDGTPSAPVSVRSAAARPAILGVADPDNAGRYFATAVPAGQAGLLGLIQARGSVLGRPEADSRAVRGVLPGEEVDLIVTGLGKTASDFTTSRLIPSPIALGATPKVNFGGTSVDASSAVLAAPGVYIVRVKVPDSVTAGDIALTVDLNGATSGDNVRLTVARQ